MRPSRAPGLHGSSSNGKMAGRSSFRPSNSAVAVALSLSLCAFALILDSSRTSMDSVELLMTGGAERDLMAMQQPKLELNVARQAQKAGSGGTVAAGAAVAVTTTPQRQPLPQGLNGQAWRGQKPRADGPRIAFIVTTSDSLQQIRVWTSYHRAIGVSTFYIFADGQAARPDNVAVLRTIPGVNVILRDAELKKRHENSRIWKESWLSAFFHKPCNHELFVLQSLNMEVGIEMAQRDGIDWLLHIDTDELIYPSGSPTFSLQQVLSEVPDDVDTLVFPNYESLPERTDVGDPYLEVSLFKKNYAHVVSDLYFKSYGTVARGNPNYFITYGNGKSAARVQQGMRPNGAHRWHSYVKTPKEWSSDQAAVLHYTYNRFSDLKSRRDRCDCAPTEEDAKRCFILPFDRMAFLEASLKNDKELMDWFKQRLVWDDPAVVNDLLKKGLFMRIYEPQLMIRGFVEAEKAEAAAEAASIKAVKDAVDAARTAALKQAAGQQQAAAAATVAQEQQAAAAATVAQQQANADQAAATVATAAAQQATAAAAGVQQQDATTIAAADQQQQQGTVDQAAVDQAAAAAAASEEQQAAVAQQQQAAAKHVAAAALAEQQQAGGGTALSTSAAAAAQQALAEQAAAQQAAVQQAAAQQAAIKQQAAAATQLTASAASTQQQADAAAQQALAQQVVAQQAATQQAASQQQATGQAQAAIANAAQAQQAAAAEGQAASAGAGQGAGQDGMQAAGAGVAGAGGGAAGLAQQ